MRAAIYTAFRTPLVVTDVPAPEPRPDAAVIEVRACGICRSDWHGWMGHDADVRLPHVPGHELAGVVTRLGRDVVSWQVGDRVTVPFSCGCGSCHECRSGNHQVCDAYTQPGFTHWGGFADEVEIRHADTNLVRIPERIDFVAAASLGCRFATAFRAVVDRGRTAPGDWVAIHGCGGVGLSAVMTAVALGARVVAVDVSSAARDAAISLGAESAVDATGMSPDDVAQAVRSASGGGVHVSIDALGGTSTMRASIGSLRRRGRHVQVGLMLGDDAVTPVPMGRVIAEELELVGGHGMPSRDYPAMLGLVASGRLDVARLVGRVIGLDDAPAALMAMSAPASSSGMTVVDLAE